jgi:hypothetical protein
MSACRFYSLFSCDVKLLRLILHITPWAGMAASLLNTTQRTKDFGVAGEPLKGVVIIGGSPTGTLLAMPKRQSQEIALGQRGISGPCEGWIKSDVDRRHTVFSSGY